MAGVIVGGYVAGRAALAIVDAAIEYGPKIVKKVEKVAENIPALPKGKYSVGLYKDLKSTPGFDAHHVGQKAAMKKFIPGYNPDTAPSILVPKVGHTLAGSKGVVSRTVKEFDNARQVIARDIRELRRVYPDIPNSQLQQLIQLNKELYPVLNSKF